MKAAKVAQAILCPTKSGAIIMLSRDEYDAQLLMFALYDIDMVEDIGHIELDLGEDNE